MEISSQGQEDHITSRRERVVRLVAVVAVVSLFVAFFLLSFPSRKNELDFSEFYSASQMVRQGLGRQLYNLNLQFEFQSKIGVVHVFYNHPPFETLLFVPLTSFGYQSAYTIWTLLSVMLLILSARMLNSHANVSLALSQYTRLRADLGLLLVVLLTFAPVTTSLLLGQDSMFLFFIYTAVFVLFRRGKCFCAGCVLACGLFKFQLIIPFVAILLMRRKWCVLKGFSITGSLLVVVSIAISGVRVLVEYPKLLLVNRTYQRIGGFDPTFMPNLRGFLYLIGGRRLPASVFAIIVALLSIVIVWLAAKNWRDEQVDISFSVGVLATLVASYHVYNYDLTLLLLPVAIICGELAQQRNLLSAPIVFTLALIVLFVPPLHRFLLLRSIYALMFIPILVLFVNIIQLNRPETPAYVGSVKPRGLNF